MRLCVKRWVVSFLAIIGLISSIKASAEEPPQCAFNPIRITNQMDLDEGKIQRAFANYNNYLLPDGSAIWICFRFSDPSLRPRNPIPNLALNSTAGGKPVYIFGLRLNEYHGTLSLAGANPITLLDSSLNGCTNCLSLAGASHRIENTQIACAPNSRNAASIGIKLLGEDHHIVAGTEIQNCAVGVQVGDAANTANNNIVDQSKIHNNGIGIKVTNGNGNFFRAASVYDNDANNDGLFAGAEGILLEDGANGGKQPPILLAADGGEIRGEAKSFLIYPKEIKKLPENGDPVNAIFRIKAATRRGELEVFLTGKQEDDPDAENFKQGMTFYNKPRLLSAVPDGIGNYILTYQMPMSIQLKNKHAVAVLHFRSFGSTTYSDATTLNPPGDIGLISAPSMDDLGAAGEQVAVAGVPGEVGGGGASDGGGNVVASDPAPLPSSPIEDDQKSGSQEMGVASPSGGGGAAQVVSGGAGGTGAPGGVGVSAGGCGGSLNPNTHLSILPFWMILFIIGTLAAFRLASKE